MSSDHKSKICPTGPWSTIVILMLHNESCDDGHFIASTALGGHRQGVARLFSWNALLLRRKIRTGPMASAKSRSTASRKKGRLLCGVKRLLEIRGMTSQRFFKQRKIQNPAPGSKWKMWSAFFECNPSLWNRFWGFLLSGNRSPSAPFENTSVHWRWILAWLYSSCILLD